MGEVKRASRKVEQDRTIKNSGESVCACLKHHLASFVVFPGHGQLQLVGGLDGKYVAPMCDFWVRPASGALSGMYCNESTSSYRKTPYLKPQLSRQLWEECKFVHERPL